VKSQEIENKRGGLGWGSLWNLKCGRGRRILQFIFIPYTLGFASLGKAVIYEMNYTVFSIWLHIF
jgi:hypothetical protein